MNKMWKIHLNLMGMFLACPKSLCCGNGDRSFKGAVRVRQGCIFNVPPLLSKRTTNVFTCAHTCLANTLCISISYCETSSKTGGKCHLFKEGIRSEQTVENFPSLVKKIGCTFYQFVDVAEGCSSMTCHNGASCYHDNDQGRYRCACAGNYTGEFCDRLEVKPIIYLFTNLQGSGRTGPTSLSSYASTTLEGKVKLLNGQQLWSVPASGRYHFDIQGASGGNSRLNNGGKGAKVSGNVILNCATNIVIVVGQQGMTNSNGGGGGGGGSFVYYDNKKIIGIAGGGGGGGGLFTQKDGEGGLASEIGGMHGSRRGHGGASCSKPGYPIPGGGGGYASDGRCFNGTCNDSAPCEAGGGSFNTYFIGGKGDSDGGFGGGGAGNGYFPGGGGGYSGGGMSANPEEGAAGGGGSYVCESSWNAVGNHNLGNGSVIITFYG